MERELIPVGSPSLDAPAFAILKATGTCWKCLEPTPVVALWVPSFRMDSDDDQWGDTDPAVLQYIEALSPEAMQQVQEAAPWLRPAHTVGSSLTYWANHCVACDAVQGDHYLFGPDGPFFPQTDEERERIAFVRARGQIQATASPASSSWMSDLGE